MKSNYSYNTCSSLPSIVPRLFHSLNSDKQALVVSAAQSQISESLQAFIYLFIYLFIFNLSDSTPLNGIF